MAFTAWIGTAVPDKEAYFWKEDVAPSLKKNETEQERFAACLKKIMESKPSIHTHRKDELWISSDSYWLRITLDGVIEIGGSGV